MDRAIALMLLSGNAIRLRPGRDEELFVPQQEARDEDEGLAGVLLNFVKMRRGNPPSGR